MVCHLTNTKKELVSEWQGMLHQIQDFFHRCKPPNMQSLGLCHSFFLLQKYIFQKTSERDHPGRSVSVDGIHSWCLKNVWMILSWRLALLASLCYTSDSASGECSEPDPSYQEQQHLQSQHWHSVTTVIVMVPFVCPSGHRGSFLFGPTTSTWGLPTF